MSGETDLPDLAAGFALRDRLVRLAQAVLRADELAARRPTFGTAEVYLTEVRYGVGELLQIVDCGGWPSFALVGRDGLDAALVIAQAASVEEQVTLRRALATAVHNGCVPEPHLVHLAALIARARGTPIDDADRFGHEADDGTA
ncbi:hypothetical protein ACFU7Y_06375 [Kitasatospora sp. NPDC057542]|uniref:hypothetical protein n=1 Tax=Kitasatospora sp. NPDC057542 TaxID=3346162 RepID=UPI00367B8397